MNTKDWAYACWAKRKYPRSAVDKRMKQILFKWWADGLPAKGQV